MRSEAWIKETLPVREGLGWGSSLDAGSLWHGGPRLPCTSLAGRSPGRTGHKRLDFPPAKRYRKGAVSQGEIFVTPTWSHLVPSSHGRNLSHLHSIEAVSARLAARLQHPCERKKERTTPKGVG